MIGATLAHFRITAKLGEGGMGEVWRAEDTRLGRQVAIKVLPERFTADAERLARFEREARVLASLSHPNVAGIFEVGEARVGAVATRAGTEAGPYDDRGSSSGRRGGAPSPPAGGEAMSALPATPLRGEGRGEGSPEATVHYLVMELVEGPTLAERLDRGPLPLAEAVVVARQIAEALEAAHAKGVVHRDLKPANVKVSPEGRVKVLDFGLARGLEDPGTGVAPGDALANSPTLTAPATLQGVILGTAAYMAPEQAAGRPVDRRADVWAWGAVLWEMLTGRRLFAGETATETLAAVLRADIPLDDLAAEVPGSVRRLLRRCLARDPADRLHDIADARIVLADLQSGRADDPALPAPARRKAVAPLAAATLAALAAGLAFAAAWSLRRSEPPPPPVADDAVVRKLTFGAGLEAEPSFSADGNSLVYTTSEGTSLDLVVLSLAGGQVRPLVTTAADEAQPAWSPDGTRIAYTRGRGQEGRLGPILGLNELTPFVLGEGGDVFLVPATGGQPVRLVERASFPAWSPDGQQIAFTSDRGGSWDIWRISAKGGEPVRLTADDEADFQPSWSPDGRWIAFASHLGLRVAPADAGQPPRRLLPANAGILSPRWSADGGWIYFSWSPTGGAMSLWRLPFAADGASAAAAPSPQRISLGESSDVDVAVSPVGSRLAWSKVEYAPDLWELDRAGGAVRQLTDTTCSEDYPHLAADGRALLFQSTCAGGIGLWALDLREGNRQPVTPPGVGAMQARWSPDGTTLAYLGIEGDGSTSLMVRSRDGLDARELVRIGGAGSLNGPQWSPDGRLLVFSAAPDTGRGGIAVVDLQGNERILVTTSPGEIALFATFTGDGSHVIYQMERVGKPRQLWMVPAAGGEPRQLTSGDHEHSHPQGTPARPDEILIVVDHRNVGVVSLRSGELTLLTDFTDPGLVIDYPSWSPDGSKVYFSITRKVGDLYLLETPPREQASR